MTKRRLFFLFSILCFFSASAQVNVSRPVAGVNSNTDATTYSFTAFTPTSRSVLVVFVVATGTVQANPTITSTGTALTWVRETTQILAGTGYYIFWARVPITVSASTITFNCTTDAPDGISMSIHSFTSVNQYIANPVLQAKISSASTTSTNATISFDKSLRPLSGYAIGWSGLFVTSNNSAAPTGFTESDDFGRNAPARNLSTARKNGGLATAGPFIFSNANTTWVVLGVEVGFTASGIPLNLLSN